jgi:hypothetical protein
MDQSSSPAIAHPDPPSPVSTLPTITTTLFDLPDDIASLRTRIFSMDSEITMPRARFEALWKFFDNIYKHNRTRRTKDSIKETRYYHCLLSPTKPHESKVEPSKRQRNRTSRIPMGCPCRIKAVMIRDEVVISRSSKEGHNHEYTALHHKNSTAVRLLAMQEVSKGYSVAEVIRNLRNPRNGNLEALRLAGGIQLSLKDVQNAGAAWLQRANLQDTKRARPFNRVIEWQDDLSSEVGC